jgi:hypothetical protein
VEEGGYMLRKCLVFMKPVLFWGKIPPHLPQVCFIGQPSDKTTKRKYQPIRELMKKILQMGIQHNEI